MQRISFQILIFVTLFCSCFTSPVSAEMAPQSPCTLNSSSRELFAAIDSFRNKTVARIVASGIDLEVRDSGGRTPFLAAAFAGNIHAARMLLQIGCNKAARDNRGNNALHQSVLGNSFFMTRFLLEGGEYSIDSRNDADETPIILATESGSQLFYTLLAAKADTSLLDSKGRTLLMHAAASNNIAMVRRLLELGASPNAKDRLQRPVIAYSMENGEITKLLVEAGANISVKYPTEDGFRRTVSPLVDAVAHNNFTAVRVILQGHADVNERVTFNIMSLTEAAIDRLWPLFWFLKESGSKLDIGLSGIPADKGGHYNGATPLILAAMDGQEEIVCRLVDEDKSLANARTEHGLTPMMLAAGKYPYMEECLRKAGISLTEEQQQQVLEMRIKEHRDEAVAHIYSIRISLDSFYSEYKSYPVDAQTLLTYGDMHLSDEVRLIYTPLCDGSICTNYFLALVSDPGKAEYRATGAAGKIEWKEAINDSSWNEVVETNMM